MSDKKDPTAADRQRRYRDKKRNATVTSHRNATVTRPLRDRNVTEGVTESVTEGVFEILQENQPIDRNDRNATVTQPVTSRLPDTDTDTDTDINPPLGSFLDFETFWEIYPRQRRGSKDKARKAWQRACRRSPPTEIIEGTRAYAASDEVARGFAKGAEAWLNDDRWTHDYSKQGEKNGKSNHGRWTSGEADLIAGFCGTDHPDGQE
jgi:hypothetical protein